MWSIRDEATEAIIAIDPRRSCESVLRLLMLYTAAGGAGLFQRIGDRLSLFASSGLDQLDLDRAYAAWEDGRESIVAGHPYTDEGYAVLPLGDAEAVLYLGAPGGLRADLTVVGYLAPLLLSALRDPGEHRSVVVDVEATPTEDFDRERLVVLLERNEWNIARVARILEVERSTVYRRMERWGIPRQRVPKRG